MSGQASIPADAVSRLLNLPPYSRHTEESEELFMRALRDAVLSHALGNPRYAAYLERKNFSPESAFSIEDLPFLPAQLFKMSGPDLGVVPKNTRILYLHSSATGGVPSSIPLDRVTARRQAACMTGVMSDFLGKKRTPFLVLDIDPHANRTNYGARGAAVRGYLRFASKAAFFMEETGEGLSFLADKFKECAENLDPEIPVVLFGFTYVLYGNAVRPALDKSETFRLPQGSKILHIGGWKKLAGEKVSKKRFAEDIETVFGVPARNVIDVYGFTEQMGLNYPDCPCGCKHVPHMSRLIVRDPATMLPLEPGKPGVMEFVTPLPNSYAGAAILTDDLGEIVPGECPFGRHGSRFRALGRLPKAEARGCGDIMAEKMRSAGKSPGDSGRKASDLKIRAWGAKPETLDALAEHARDGAKWLAAQPFELVIGLIDSAAASWEKDPALSGWLHRGLSFLSRWCSRANLTALAAQALRGMPEALDRFAPEKARKTHFLRALPLGVVCHWLSGNAPFLSMLALVQSLAAKNANILKTAANNFDALETLLATFGGKKYVSPSGATIRGDDLLRAVSLVHFPHSRLDLGAALSGAADARIAWGGREAVDAICALPAKAGAPDLIFGPKTSFMVIAREALSDESKAKKLLRRAASDVSSFDQAACSSPHTIFVETGAFITPMEFAKRLGGALEMALTLIPPREEDEARAAAVQFARARGEFLGYCWHSQGPGWTVIYNESFELAAPVYSRTVTVCPVADIMQTAALVNPGIQTIGLAAGKERGIRFAEAAAPRGAMRFPEIGAMTAFDAPWDGMFIMDRLVRWASFGGAASVIARNRE